MKYIDAEKLIAEIERQKRENLGSPECVCDDILSLIASLQQEQPESGSSEKPNNLLYEWNEEIYKTWWSFISGKINVEHMMEWYMHETARHFYSLGLKARKEG